MRRSPPSMSASASPTELDQRETAFLLELHVGDISMRACTSDVSLYILPWRMQPVYFGSAATRPLDDPGERAGEINAATFNTGRSIAFKATRDELTRVLGASPLKVVLSDGLLHDGVCIGCARVDIRDKFCPSPAAPPCAVVSCSMSALLEDEWGGVQAVASLSLRLLDLGHSVLPHLITSPLQQLQVDSQQHSAPSSRSCSGHVSSALTAVSVCEDGAIQEGSRHVLHDAAAGPDVPDMDEWSAHSRAQRPPPADGSRCHVLALDVCGADALSAHSQQLPPLVAKDRWSVRGASRGDVPQPPPLYLSKA